ncbi:MAG: MFS transporter [Dehalococcoidia bacterium]|nr:MFS transporter [Ardenticatenales bacterium]MBK9547116.1 MFS transporter [Dehalococcoidia bacterium]
MSLFHRILANSLVASVVNTFVWFAVTFWVYLETRSVIATSVMAGIYTVTVALSGFALGTIVDRYPKKAAMLASSLASLALYVVAAGVYAGHPPSAFRSAANWPLWAFVLCTLIGAIAGNLRGITLSTLVTTLVPADMRDRANGLVGTANGVAFLAASIFSGLAIGYLGVTWMLVLAIGLTALVVADLVRLTIPDVPPADAAAGDVVPPAIHPSVIHAAVEVVPEVPGRPGIDLRGTIAAVRAVPGLFGLIFFQTFNNFLGGVFMALMDAYGLLLVSVQVWGALWGGLSVAFIVGGIAVARFGLGARPLRALFAANIAMWAACIAFPLRASIVLLTAGMFVWLSLAPVAEAAEQTILQKVVSPERQGRVFGFAQSVEQAATPITAFLIGPIAEFVFIPYMTTGAGVAQLGPWFGTGPDRGLGLVFVVVGCLGLAVTVGAMRTRAYRALSAYDTAGAAGASTPAEAAA